MNNSAAHTALVNAILAELGALPGVVLGINSMGKAMHMSATGKRWVVPYGWPTHEGGADLLACVRGRLVALEVKTGNATTTKEQRACLAALKAAGAVVAVVRSVDEARAAIEEARRTL